MYNDSRSVWTDDRDAIVKAEWTAGTRSGQIAAMIGGVTKNAVIGRAHRLGLGPHRLGLGPHRRGSTRVKTKAAIARADKYRDEQRAKRMERQEAQARAKVADARPPTIKPQPLPVFAPLFARKSFEALETTDCRMPVGHVGEPGFGFCGQPAVVDKPYCPSCCHRAFIASPARGTGRPLIFSKTLARLG